jgi:hypothetical protein
MVTYLSSACTLLAVYYINNNDNNYAAVAYAIGYLLDCIDGKMARKYNNAVLAIDNDEGARAAYRKEGIKAIHPNTLSDNTLTKNIWNGIFR